jgi:hypothetical protein
MKQATVFLTLVALRRVCLCIADAHFLLGHMPRINYVLGRLLGPFNTFCTKLSEVSSGKMIQGASSMLPDRYSAATCDLANIWLLQDVAGPPQFRALTLNDVLSPLLEDSVLEN